LRLNGSYLIECHHKHPLSAGVRDTIIGDLISLCPTCHRITHTGDEPLPLGKLSLHGKESNNEFKGDSQRLGPSLQVSFVFIARGIRLGVSVVHTLIWH